jgi:RpiR family transcriptional regulator, carbohydrate utilization regulator
MNQDPYHCKHHILMLELKIANCIMQRLVVGLPINKLLMLYNNSKSDDFNRQLIFYILKNIHIVPKCSSYKLAELCFVSPAAIRRFVKELGFDSYPAFKFQVGWQLSHYMDSRHHLPPKATLGEGCLVSVAKSAKETISNMLKHVTEEQIEAVADTILAHSRICFFTTRGSPQQYVLQADLIFLGKEVTLYTIVQNQEKGIYTVDENTVAIFLKVDVSESRDVYHLLQIAKDRGATTVIISNIFPQREKEYADYLLTFDGPMCLTDLYSLELIQEALSLCLRRKST